MVDWFSEQGTVVVEAAAEEHDRTMDVVQGLRHFATFTLGRFLCERGVDLERTLELSSPIYRLEMAMVGRLFAQDPRLYAEIIFSSPRRRELMRRYVLHLQENLEMLENDDREGFVESFERVARWFGPHAGNALEESGEIIEGMIRRSHP